MELKINKGLLTFILIFTVLSVKSQTVKNATHYYFYKMYDDYYSDSLSIKETVDLTNYNESAQKYYLIEFNNSLNHIIEILFFENDTVGILTDYFYEVEEVKLTKQDKKDIKGKKIKKYNYNIWSDTTLIDKNKLRILILSLERANLNASIDRHKDGFLICEGKRSFHISVKTEEETISLGINEACLTRYNLNDNLIPVIYLLLEITDWNNLINKELPINQMFKTELQDNYAFVKCKKSISKWKPIY